MTGAAVLSSNSKPQVASDQAALLERAIARGFPLLMFPRMLEERFVEQAKSKRFFMMVVAGFFAVLLFGGMIIADYLMTPDALGVALPLRWGFFPPVIFVGLFVLGKLRMPAVNEWLIAGTGLLAVLLQAAIMMASHDHLMMARVVEFNIIIVYTCAIARFWPAVTMAVASMFVHGYIVGHLPDATGLLPFNTTLLAITCTVFVLYGNYKLEHDERMAFLLDSREQALNAELTEAHDRLHRMATTDMLTNLANRRYFESFLDECWGIAQEQHRVVSLIILDIDYFKPYNDRYGHQAGDQCLIKVGQALRTCIRRPGDLVARWGGEEFVVVLMDTDVDAAAAAAERIRAAVAAMDLVHEGSACAQRVTVSGGRASMRPDASDTSQHLINMADEALYRAKAAGRNRVYVGYERHALAEQA